MAQQVPRDLVLLGFYHSFTMQASSINILIMVATILHVGYNVPQSKATLNAFAGLGESYLSPSLGKGHKPENTVLGPELSSLIPSCPEENIPPSTGLQHMADAELWQQRGAEEKRRDKSDIRKQCWSCAGVGQQILHASAIKQPELQHPPSLRAPPSSPASPQQKERSGLCLQPYGLVREEWGCFPFPASIGLGPQWTPKTTK